ncbi:glycoside hydrolase family 97 catalytic domain-containing protein [Anaeromassilibacillus senegalensis]|uniref:glycoside hydrolase family 97 catalytic domain-containing protein n=1 Tax=Anaeromassilibacillus senegalensis TaxID=1673717 RepID=UPI00068048F6|nr:glycoside hydrolase family 97 catalytic domain-containing protein [Anaeromassilibacillus senegalensis]
MKKRNALRSAIALILAAQMAMASGATVMAQTEDPAALMEAAAVEQVEEAAEPEAETIERYVSDMEYVSAQVGWQNLMIDEGYEDLPLKLRTEDGGTKVYNKGLCAHADSEVVYDIEGRGAMRFQSYIGVNYTKTSGTVIFIVKADDEEIYRSEMMRESDVQQFLDLEIPEGTKLLTLITDKADGSNNSDHSVWADAKVVFDASVQKDLRMVTASADKTLLEVDEKAKLSLSGALVDDSKADLSKADIVYTSSDDSIAEVDDKGVVTGLANGLATITCEVTLDGITKTAEVNFIIGSEVEGRVWSVASPDGKTGGVFMLDDHGKLAYSAQQNGQSILNFSAMGMNTSAADFTEGLTFVGVTESKEVDETYTVHARKLDAYKNHYNERVISFEKDGVGFDVTIRSYDDGLAFRYTVQAEDGEEIEVHDEATTFQIPAKSKVWSMAYGNGNFSYESFFYENTVESLGGNQTMPLLYETPDGAFGMISEADIAGYMGSMVVAKNGTLKVNATTQQSGDAVVTGPFAFPWRFVVAGDLGTINVNTMTENLSPDPDPEMDYSWAKPGVTSWTWLVGYAGMQSDPNAIKKYLDFSAEMGWDYFIMDEGWQPRPGSGQGDGGRYWGEYDWFPEVRDYADEVGIGLLAWVHCDDLNTPEKRAARLPRWAKLGIKGIKVDFFDRENQDRVQLMEDIYKECAELGLIVNAHGANKPTGEVRTYPNIMTREGIYGQEMGDLKAEQYTIMPFTRNAVGPADVTETVYPRGSSTTIGFQMAVSVLYTSGLHCFASSVEDYQGSGGISFYKNFPAVWDGYHFIDGYPGEYTALARKSGEEWYAAAISTDARDAKFPLDFLDEGQEYYAAIYRDDGTNARSMKMEFQKVTSKDTLTIPVKKGGGCAIRLSKEKPSAAETIEFDQSEMTVERNRSQRINATITPEKPAIPNLIWESSDPEIATVDGSGMVTGLKPGTAVITAKSPVDPSVNDSCTVTVELEKYTLDRDTWEIQRERSEHISYTGPNSLVQNSLAGDIDGNADLSGLPKNMIVQSIGNKDFTTTVKVSGGLEKAFQTISLTAFVNNKNVISMMRRYHSNFGGNCFELMKFENGYNETPVAADTQKDDAAYLKLERKGNVFTGYYSYDGVNWTKVRDVTSSGVANAADVKIGVFATNGSGNNENISITVEDFTYYENGEGEGTVIPFAVSTEKCILNVPKLDPLGVSLGKAFESLNLPKTMKVTLADGSEKELTVTWEPGEYNPNVADTYTLQGSFILADGVMNLVGYQPTLDVVVSQEDRSVIVNYGKNVTLKVNGEEQKLADLIGRYTQKDVDSGTKLQLAFAPRLENELFRSVSVDGAEPTVISGREYLYDFTMGMDAANLQFVFETVNKTTLDQVVAYAKARIDAGEIKGLLPVVQEKFMAAYDAAVAVQKDAAATQGEINTAWKDLMNMLHYLEFKPGDKKDLDHWITVAESMNADLFTEASWAVVANALAEAKGVMADENALQGDITKARDTLYDAIMALVDKVDRTELDAFIAEGTRIEGILDTDYLPVGQEAFKAALKAARELPADADQAAVNAAALRLVEAMSGLRLIPTREALKEQIDAAESIDRSLYTASSLMTLDEKIAAAKDAYENAETQEEITKAFDELVDAQEKLTKRQENGKTSSGSSTSVADNSYGSAGTAVAGAQNTAAYVRSDTTMNFALKRGQAYCFKMTVFNGNGLAPNFTVGDGSVLKTQFVAQIGNDYYFRVWAIGAPGTSAGVYTSLNGKEAVKHCTVSIA